MPTTADLTREQILALPAGPELDALIAEKVMGWRGGERGVSGGFWVDADGKEVARRCSFSNIEPAWSPSTSNADAEQVVEEVRKRFPPKNQAFDEGPWFQIQWPCRYRIGGHANMFLAGWAEGINYEGQSFVRDLWAHGQTPALAICRAALLAVLEERKTK